MNIYDGVTVAELLEGYGIYKQLINERILNVEKGNGNVTINVNQTIIFLENQNLKLKEDNEKKNTIIRILKNGLEEETNKRIELEDKLAKQFKSNLMLKEEVIVLEDKIYLSLRYLKELKNNMERNNPYNRNIYTIKRLDNIINILKGDQKDDN